MPIPNDKSLVAQYIRAIENPDSIGFREGKWFQSPRKVDDSNNRGFGVDIRYNNKARELTESRKGKWLTEREERDLRNQHIGYSMGVLDKWTPKVLETPPSEAKKAMATGMIYRGDGVKSIINNPALRDAYYSGTDADFQKEVSNYYKSKQLPERAKNHNQFIENSALGNPWQAYEWKPVEIKSDGGSLKGKDWNELTMAEKSAVMQLAVQNGMTNLDDIRGVYNEFAKGGTIHIKPENRGKFTALKKRTGHSASWFKAHGTPAQKKMAVFALNARKWKHAYGGELDI